MVVSPSGDGMTHRVWNCPAFLLVVFVCLTLSPSGDGITLPVWWKWLDFAGFGGIGRVELSVEGGFESGGWCRRAFLLFMLIGLSLSPSGDRMTLRVWNRPAGWVGTAGFCGFCPDWEGGTVMGGRFCLGRAVLACVFAVCICLADVIALLVQNRPPITESPSNNRISLRVYVKSPLFGLDC